MSSTPEKIEKSIEISEKSLNNLSDLFEDLQSIVNQIRKEESNLLNAFDEVPVDRLRNIRPYIEEYLDSTSEIEVLYEVLKNVDTKTMQSDLTKLKHYFEGTYMQSVRNRENRRRGR